MIKLTVTPAAADWIKETLKLVVGNGVNFTRTRITTTRLFMGRTNCTPSITTPTAW